MIDYEVTVTETRTMVRIVAAESAKEAADKIDNLITSEEIKLDASNAAYHVKIEAKPKDKPFTHTQQR